MGGFKRILIWAARDLRGGLKHFAIFIACLVLGVAAISSIGAVTSAFQAGMGEESRVLLGGDMEVALSHREVREAEMSWLETYGEVSLAASTRAMAFKDGSDRPLLVELKGVDDLYPLFGSVDLSDNGLFSLDHQDKEGFPPAYVESTLLSRLDVVVGDNIRLGRQWFRIVGVLVSEPDRVAAGFRYGPRVMTRIDAVRDSGLIAPGALVRYYYRVRFPADTNHTDLTDRFQRQAKEMFPEAGWRVRNHRQAAPGVRNFVDEVAVFLTLVGLAALIVGGIGVGNGVREYLDKKQEAIATFKCLGATSGQIFATYLAQVMMLAGFAIVLGLAVGAMAPLLLATTLGDRLPIPISFGIYPGAMLLAAIFGVLVTLIFSTWPLARAREIPAGSLFRALVAPAKLGRRWPYVSAIIATMFVLYGVCLIFSGDYLFTTVFLAGVSVAIAVLGFFGWVVKKAASLAPRSASTLLRLAQSNLHRPGAPTISVVISAGIGLTLLTTVSLIEGNLNNRIDGQIPAGAPAFFFIDVPKVEIDRFEKTVKSAEGVTTFRKVPNLRGRIISLDGVPAGKAEISPDVKWVLRGDQNVTYSNELPDGSRLVEGTWWESDYSGEPQVSLSAEIARGLGLEIGDDFTMNILGRNINAKVASFRDYDWRAARFNYIFVFSPNTLEHAPFMYVGNVDVAPEHEEALYLRITNAFPAVSVVRVKEALQMISSVLEDLTLGVRVVGGVTLVAGLFVLAGTLASGMRRRIYDAVVLKVLGATRATVLGAYFIEYALLGLVAGLISLGLGTLASWAVVSFSMDFSWVFLPDVALTTVGGAIAFTIGLGLLGTWRVLSAKPTSVLRSE